MSANKHFLFSLRSTFHQAGCVCGRSQSIRPSYSCRVGKNLLSWFAILSVILSYSDKFLLIQNFFLNANLSIKKTTTNTSLWFCVSQLDSNPCLTVMMNDDEYCIKYFYDESIQFVQEREFGGLLHFLLSLHTTTVTVCVCFSPAKLPAPWASDLMSHQASNSSSMRPGGGCVLSS